MVLEEIGCVSFFGSNWLLRIFQWQRRVGNSRAWWKFSIINYESLKSVWLWGCHERLQDKISSVFKWNVGRFLLKISPADSYLKWLWVLPTEHRVGVVNFTTPSQVSRTTQWPGHWRLLILAVFASNVLSSHQAFDSLQAKRKVHKLRIFRLEKMSVSSFQKSITETLLNSKQTDVTQPKIP